MRLGGFLLASVAGLLFALPASALTISNEDPDPHTITVTAGTDTKQVTVEPDQQVDAVCAAGCMLELENGEQYQMQGGETVSIEDGVIFVDAAPGSDNDDGDTIIPATPVMPHLHLRVPTRLARHRPPMLRLLPTNRQTLSSDQFTQSEICAAGFRRSPRRPVRAERRHREIRGFDRSEARSH